MDVNSPKILITIKSFDKDKSGQIDAGEFKQVCKSMGHSDVSDAQI